MLVSKKNKFVSCILIFAVLLSGFVVTGSSSSFNRNPYEKIKGASADELVRITNRGSVVGISGANAYLMYSKVEFTSQPQRILINVAVDKDYEKGILTFVLDKPEGKEIARHVLTSTGGFNTYGEQMIDITTEISGVHDLYVVFSKNGACNFDWFQFKAYKQASANNKIFHFNDVTKNDTNSNAANMLFQLGILAADNKGNFRPDGITTRADAAIALCKLENIITSKNMIFNDVKKEDYSYSYISAAVSMGLINSYSDGNFRPNEAVTLDTLVEGLLKVAGYGQIAEYKGGYRNLAYEKSILKNINLTPKGILRSDFALMLYRTANLSTLVQNSIGSKAGFYSDDSQTVLTEKHKIFKGYGIVTMFGGVSLTSVSISDGEDVMEIDSKKYKSNGFDLSSYLGMEIEFYYKDENDELLLYSVLTKENKNRTMELMVDDILSFRNYEIEYEKNDNTYYIKFDGLTTILFNGEPFQIPSWDYDWLDFEPSKNFLSGSVKLLDRDNDGKYDLINVLSYKNAIVRNALEKDKKIFCLEPYSTLTQQFSFSDDSRIKIYKDNKIIYLDELTYGDTISVATGKSGFLNSIIVSNHVIAGTVIESDEKNILINDKTYKLSKQYKGIIDKTTNDNYNIPRGMGSFYINFLGEIVLFRANTIGSEWEYGFLLKVRGKGHGLESAPCFRIISMDSNITNYNGASKIVVDSMVYVDGLANNEPYDILNAFKNGNEGVRLKLRSGETDNGVQPQLIKFMLNSSGEIKAIDTEYRGLSENDTTLTRNFECFSNTDVMLFEKNSKMFKNGSSPNYAGNGKYYVNNSSIMLLMPFDESMNNEEEYYLISADDYDFGDAILKFAVYDTDMGRASKVVLMRFAAPPYKYLTTAGVVYSVKKQLDENGDIKNSLSIFENGKLTDYSFAVNENADKFDLKKGDVVEVVGDINGKISDIHPIYVSDGSDNFVDGVAPFYPISSDGKRTIPYLYDNVKQGTLGTYIYKFGSLGAKLIGNVKLRTDEGFVVSFPTGDTTTDWRFVDAKGMVTILDKKGTTNTLDDKIYSGDFSDIYDAETVGEGNESFILVNGNYYGTISIIVIKNKPLNN
jgi:hypothetical protein